MMLAAASESDGWPHFLLSNGCEKGLALVGGARRLPRIMNVIPTEDPSVLEVYRSDACEHECAGALAEGDTVASGTPLTLVYAGTSLPDTHTTFVSSSGLLAGGESCGDEGASLLCSSCGEGW